MNCNIFFSARYTVLDESTKNKYQIRAGYTGDLNWIISESFTVMCKMDVLLFPFDIQTCSLKFTGYIPDKSQNYTGIGIITKYLLIKKDWELINHSFKSQDHQYQSVSVVQFLFTVRRKPEFYIITMIIPLFIFSFLGLLVFALPAESGEKISLGITCLLSFSVIQASVTEHLPSGFSDMPHVGK